MEEKKNLPQAISYKKLSLLMLKAKKDNLISSDNLKNENTELEEFLKSLEDFEKASKEIINKISHKNEKFLSAKSSNSIMALGAMEAHLNMALQAINIFKNDTK
tara:strand:- start:175 stop:486 length:312 start_codon:yes stop_codon:yes gene_type:complete